MTNTIGYANPAAVSFGTLMLEMRQVTRSERAKAEAVVRSWLPDVEATEVLIILGLKEEGK